MQSQSTYYHNLSDTLLAHELDILLNGSPVTVIVNASYAIMNAWRDHETSACDYDLALHSVTVSDAYRWQDGAAAYVPITSEVIALAHKGVEQYLHKRVWELLSRE